MRRRRLAVVVLRKDVANHFGRLQVRAAQGCCPQLLEDWLDPPEMHMPLWAPADDSAFVWRLTPGGDEETNTRKRRPGHPISVAVVADRLGGGKVFVGRLPAVGMLPHRLGAAVWVQQQLTSGGVAVRRLHQSELQRLFRTPHAFQCSSSASSLCLAAFG